MKKPSIIKGLKEVIIILCFHFVFIFANSQDISIKAGYGYFAEPHQFFNPGNGISLFPNNSKTYGKLYQGSALNCEFGILIPSTGYIFSLGFTKAHNSHYYNDVLGILWDIRQFTTFSKYALLFERPIKLKKHNIMPQLGFSYNRLSETLIDYSVFQDTTGTWHPGYIDIMDRTLQDLGLTTSIGYFYNITPQWQVGVQLNTYWLFGVGFESFSLCPYLRIAVPIRRP